MNDDLQTTHDDLLDQAKSISEALQNMSAPEREELLAQATAIISALEGMKI